MNFGGGSSFRGGPQEEGAARSKGFDIQLMGRLLAYLRPYWGWVILTFGAVLSASLLRQLGPYITKIAVDDYIIPGDRSGFGWLIFLYVGITVLHRVCADLGDQYGRTVDYERCANGHIFAPSALAAPVLRPHASRYLNGEEHE